MSWYFVYTLGVKTKEDKIYPIGPFDWDGTPLDVICNSRSFEPEDLHSGFINITEEQSTPELMRAMNNTLELVSYLPLSELPAGSPFKKGYFLNEDIEDYESGRCTTNDDIFYDHLTCEQYLRKLEAQLKFGRNAPEYDAEGNEMDYHPCEDYSYYMYVDDHSAEWCAEQLRVAADLFDEWRLKDKFGEGCEIVAILSQG